MTRPVALPMYDLAEVRAATDAWWRGLAKHLRAAGLDDVPEALTRNNAEATWTSPDLLLAQTCGYPLTHDLADRVRVVATPSYDAPGYEGAFYRSLIIVGADDPAIELADLRGRRATINDYASQSGFNALRAAIAPLTEDGRFFSSVAKSGGHRFSLAMVNNGKADVCAVDGVTHALLQTHASDDLAGTRILCETPLAAPGLPYVTASGDLARLRDGVMAAADDPALAMVRKMLLISGFQILSDDAYDVIVEMERLAEAHGATDSLS